MRNCDSFSQTASTSRYSAALNLSQFGGDFPPPAKESSSVEAPQTKLYQDTQQQYGLTLAHPSR